MASGNMKPGSNPGRKPIDRSYFEDLLDGGDVYGVMLKISELKMGIYPPFSEDELQGFYRSYIEKKRAKSISRLYDLTGKPPSRETLDGLNPSGKTAEAIEEALSKYDWQQKHREGLFKGKRKAHLNSNQQSKASPEYQAE